MATWARGIVCDKNPDRLARARELIHEVIAGEDADQLIENVEVDVLGVFTLADLRSHFIRAALRRRQHVIAEKPIAASIPEEEALLREEWTSRLMECAEIIVELLIAALRYRDHALTRLDALAYYWAFLAGIGVLTWIVLYLVSA